MKFAQTVSKEEQQELHKIYQQHACFRTRQRAHAILLSLRGYPLNQIQDILQADRDSISVGLTGLMPTVSQGWMICHAQGDR